MIIVYGICFMFKFQTSSAKIYVLSLFTYMILVFYTKQLFPF